MAERDLLIRIVGDASSLEREFRKVDRSFESSGKATEGFKDQLSRLGVSLDDVRVRAARGRGVGLLRFAGVGVGAGVAIAATTRAIGDLRQGLEVTGEEAETFSGRVRNVSAALLGGDLVGAFQAMTQETHRFTAAQVEAIAVTPVLIEMLRRMGDTAAVAAAAYEAMAAIVETPVALQLQVARAGGTSRTTDDLTALDLQIAQKAEAIARINRLRGLEIDQANADRAIIEILNQRNALEARRDKLIDDMNKARRDAAARAAKAAAAPFRALVKGLGLKADKALLTATLADDLAATEELIRAIQRQIRAEGRTFDLIDQLTQARLARSAVIAQQQAAAQAAAAAAAAAAAQVAAEAEERARKAEEQARKAEERARKALEAAKKARLGRQFEALGLTAEGAQRIPSVRALSKRLGTLREQVKGTPLDTEKTRSQLQRIARVLSGAFGKVGKDVRSSILQMFADIFGALEKADKKGPLTKTSGLNTKKILAGLGLSPEEIRELRGRLSSINTAGRQFAAPGGGPGVVREGGFGNNPIFVESHTTINLDGQKVANVVTRNQQRTRRRNPRQKRGPNRIGGV